MHHVRGSLLAGARSQYRLLSAVSRVMLDMAGVQVQVPDLPDLPHDVDAWAYAKRLLFTGDPTGRLISTVVDRMDRGQPVDIPYGLQEQVLKAVQEHGFAAMGRRSDKEKQMMLHATAALMSSPADGWCQLLYASTMGTTYQVDWLLNRPVDPVHPIQPYLVNTALEFAAGMGHVDVVRKFLECPHADVNCFSHDAMGLAPMDQLLAVIKCRQRVYTLPLTQHWEVVRLLVYAQAHVSPGVGEVVVTAPLPLLRLILETDAGISRCVPSMLAHLIENHNHETCRDSQEWSERFRLVLGRLPDTHPMHATWHAAVAHHVGGAADVPQQPKVVETC